MSEEKNQARQNIERAIERARDGVGEHVDELDRQLRESLDFSKKAAEHAPVLLAGGAVLGLLAGMGFPKKLTRAIQLAVPLLIVAKVAKSTLEDKE